MAIQWVMFRAEKGHPVPASPFDNPLKSLFEFWSLCHSIVVRNSITKELWSGGPSAKFAAQKRIFNSDLLQRCLKRILIELRVHARKRRRSDVGYGRDPSVAKKFFKASLRMTGMSNRKYR